MGENKFLEIEEIIAKNAIDRHRHNCSIELGACESEIEKLLLSAIIACFNEEYWDFEIFDNGITDTEISELKNSVIIVPQAKIDRFRADFLIATRCSDRRSYVVVECDGHEFHERTKEQSERDKSRDRRLLELGYMTVRFAGSEIWRSAYSCACELRRIVDKLLEEN
jgi:very-short-patch-repair endonuclease